MKINLRHLCAINKYAASTEDTRYYLNGVFVVADGLKATMVATDGHRMVVHRVPLTMPEFFSCIVPRKFLEGFKFSKRDSGDATLHKDGNFVEVGYAGTVSRVAEVDGTFPAWERIRPADDVQPSPSVFNGQYCADFDSLAKAFGTFAVITPRGADSALVTFGGRDDIYGLLHPMYPEKRPFAMRAPF